MSIVLDALKKTSASEKTSPPNTKTPGSLPSRGSFFTVRRLVLLGIIGFFIVGIGTLVWLNLSRNPGIPAGPGVRHAGEPPGFAPEDPAMVLYQEGTRRLRSGDYAGALSKFSEIVSRRPNSPQAHNNLGIVLKKMGRGEAAGEEYRKALALDPDYVEAMNNLAVLYRDRGKRGEAEALFLRALSKGPDYAEAHLNYALFLEGTGRQGEARSHYQSYLRLAPPGDPMSIRTKELLR